MNEIVLQQMWFANKNAISKRFYLGVLNQRKLTEAGYKTPERLTYNQAKLNGMRIKAGAKWVVVKYEDRIEVEKRIGDQIVKETVPYIRLHTVFNIEQTEPVKSN